MELPPSRLRGIFGVLGNDVGEGHRPLGDEWVALLHRRVAKALGHRLANVLPAGDVLSRKMKKYSKVRGKRDRV